MAACNLIETSIDAAGDGKDTVIYTYLCDLGQVVENPLLALQMAQSTGPDNVPGRRAKLQGVFLFANNISGRRTNENRQVWKFDVTFGPPPEGEDETQQEQDNPLLRPPIYGIDYIDEEYVVEQARNVEALGVEFAAGAPYRAADTLAPITNGAGIRPDEPIVRTRRRGVIRIQRNYADLGTILDMNEDYQDTTNSDEITIGNKTFSPRRLKYELTREGGKQIENGITYYPGVTEIAIHKTTDLIIDNVSFSYYTVAGALKRFLDDDGEPLADPQNITRSGLQSSSKTTITYRDLEQVAYAGFFE